ncbi:MAG: hypothetical protein ACE5Z5_08750 [Candidatus Bathyarchaeia archaeon]
MEKEISDLLTQEHTEKAVEQWNGNRDLNLLDDVNNFVMILNVVENGGYLG